MVKNVAPGTKASKEQPSKPHPLESCNCFITATLSWVNKELSKAKKGSQFQQDDHYDLPESESIEGSKLAFMSTFQQEKRSLRSTLLRVMKWEALKLILLNAVGQALQQAYPLILGLLIKDLRDGNLHGAENQRRIGFYFVGLVLSTLLSGVVNNYATFRLMVLSLRLTNGVNCLIFDKIMKFNVLNHSKHTVGNIVNYVQVDAPKMANIAQFISVLSSVLNLVIGLVLIQHYIGPIGWWMALVFISGILGSIFYTKYRIRIIEKLLKAKDQRVSTLSNVINNIKFIKIKGWENFFQYKVAVKRGVELTYLLYLVGFNLSAMIINWIQTSNLQASFILLSICLAPDRINLATVSSVLSILKIFFELQINLPGYLSQIIDMRVSLDRLQEFLVAQEVSASRITALTEEDDPQSILAVSLSNGDFVWDQAPKDEGKEDTKSNKSKSVPSQDPLKKSLLGHDDQNNSLVDDGNGILTKNENPWAFRIQDINIRIKKGSLVFVIGEIGCGKSSLLYALCGEMNKNLSYRQDGDSTPGDLKVRGEIGLLSQNPWLLSGTVLDNIILDKDFDPERLEAALKASQLDVDVAEMADGVHTFIGENGGSVSGGQRTRIALARLIYQDPDVFVLDDPLSALDLKVADKIMKEGICGELKDKTRIISTHAIHNLKYADYVYVMDQGRVVFEGTFSQMTENEIYNDFRKVTQSFDLEGANPENVEKESQPAPPAAVEELIETREVSATTVDKAENMLRSNQTEAIDLDAATAPEVSNQPTQTDLVQRLFLEEDRVQGKIGLQTIATCVRELGGAIPVVLVMLSVFLMFAVMFFNDYYNLEWAKNFDPEDKFSFLKILLFLLYARPVIILIRGFFVFGSQLMLSRNMHAKMMFRVLHAQIGEFLERVPAGRIINRFTKDIDVLDREIGFALSSFYYSLGGVIVNICILVWTVGPTLLAPLSVFLFVGGQYQRKVMNTKREVVRLQGVSRSPVISGVSGALKGLSEIRVMSKYRMVTEEFIRKLTENSKNSFLVAALDAWYQIRINAINAFLIQVPGFLILIYFLYVSADEYPIEKVIFFVLRSMYISGDLTSLLLSVGLLETQLISLERCEGFSKIQPESRYLNFELHEKKYLHPNKPAALKSIMRDMVKNDGAIISKGEVVFENVSARYPTKPNYVLQNLSLHVPAATKVGIVGRTGAGKTSLIKLFWQCLEPSSGKVYFDGTDIMRADLKTLRSNIDIISQETAIFEGTLRENLDPRLEFLFPKDSPEFKKQEKILLEKLYSIGFTEASLKFQGLDFIVSAGGSNLSLGQRQLLSFMRILIAPKKLMILDEATANIDLKTEKLMQDAVRSEFKDSTMFIIAHRLQTVLDCDQIILMDKGQIIEYGPPRELISKPNGKFKEMVDKLQDNILD